MERNNQVTHPGVGGLLRAALLLTLGLVLAFMFSHGVTVHDVVALLSSTAIAGLKTAGFSFPVQSKTVQQLKDQANPAGGSQQGMSEAVPWIFYDTQTYTSATTLQLTFFAAAQSDRSLSNMQAGGILTDPQYFEAFYMGCDILEPVTSTATGVTGAWDDVQKLVIDSRARFALTLSDKLYGPFPLSFLHCSGGVQGYAFNEAAAGAVKGQFAQNSIPDGGWCWNGAITIPPSTGFQVVVDFAAAQTLVANRSIRLWMAGVLHRRIV